MPAWRRARVTRSGRELVQLGFIRAGATVELVRSAVMRRRVMWLALVGALVIGGIAMLESVRSASAQKGELTITGKK